MDINPLQPFIRMEKQSSGSTYVAQTNASESFSSLLSNVVSREMVPTVQAGEASVRSSFREKKFMIEHGEEMKEEDEEQESVYKLVRKIETKLIKLARLERQMMTGF